MNTVTIGRRAETEASNYLQKLGYEIIDRNWRTRYCEIDIVAGLNQVIWFVEVKYRSRNVQGSGLDYVTPQKLQQMRFAAKVWVQANAWCGSYELAAIEVASSDYKVTHFVKNL